MELQWSPLLFPLLVIVRNAFFSFRFHPIAILLILYHLVSYLIEATSLSGQILYARSRRYVWFIRSPFPPPLASTADGKLSYYAVFEFLIFAPFREEVIFRGLLFDTLSTRYAQVHRSPSNPD